jgi:hypothetical protein
MYGYKKYQNTVGKKNPIKPEYKKFRVKTTVKSFRDLEVYKQTTQLSSEIFNFEISDAAKNRIKLTEEIGKLYNLSKHVPRLIAESYGDKFNNLDLALDKLEKSMQLISSIIAKIDFLTASVDSQDTKEVLNKFLKKYQIQRIKILNLKRAWERVFKR